MFKRWLVWVHVYSVFVPGTKGCYNKNQTDLSWITSWFPSLRFYIQSYSFDMLRSYLTGQRERSGGRHDGE